MALIYAVEDDKNILEIEMFALKNSGYQVEGFECARDFYKKLEEKQPDLALLDIMLPDGNGLQLLERLRRADKRENVIIISARDSLEDKVLGLKEGADDYLPKPFHLAELSARIQSVIRRSRGGGKGGIALGNVTLDPESCRVEIDGKEVALLKKEFDILSYFMQRPRHVVDKAVLAEAVWGDHVDQSDNFHFVYSQVKNLHRKLEEAGASIEIKAVYGFGYKLID